MVNTTVIPVSTATTQTLLVEAEEKVCKAYCIGSVSPSVTTSFSVGTVRVTGGYAIVPITETITVVTPSSCGCATTQVFTEKFDVAFASTTDNAITLTTGSTISEPGNVSCCKARGVRVASVITLAIS